MSPEPLPASIAARVGDLEYVDSGGRRWTLGFDNSTSPPGVVWVAVTTWGYMKGLFSTWEQAELTGAAWGTAKTF